jgi:hypothetical protein
MDSEGFTMITTPAGIEHFMMASAIARLKIEVNTGMSFSRGSTLKALQHLYGINARTKAKGLEQMLALYKEKYGRDYGSDQPFNVPEEEPQPSQPEVR